MRANGAFVGPELTPKSYADSGKLYSRGVNPAPAPPELLPQGSRLNSTAVFSLCASLAGFICLFGFGGILGVVLALVARSEIARSEGREHGRGVANVGLALGVLNLAALFIGLAALITLAAGGSRTSSLPPTVPAPIAPPFLPPAPVPPPAAGEPQAVGQATRERDTRTTVIGKITLVDPGAEPGRLQNLLRSEIAAAEAEHQKPLLFVVTPDCSPCNGVAVSLVRVDVREFAPELDRLGVPLDRIPGFALLGPDLRVLDHVDGGEWDADIPKNIAPVLGAFIRGTYTERRREFRATLRGGEQAL
jgi:hypothetical protein